MKTSIPLFKTHFSRGLFYFIVAALAVSVILRFAWNTPYMHLFTASIIAAFIATIASQQVYFSWKHEGIEIACLTTCCISAFGVFKSSAVHGGLLVLLNAALLGYLVRFVLRDDRKNIDTAIVFIGLLVAIEMIAYSVLPNMYLPIIINPNICAGYLILCYLLAVPRLRDTTFRVVAIVLITGLLLTKSRAAIAIVSLCTAGYWWQSMKSSDRLAILGLMTAGAVIALSTATIDVSFLNRIAWWQTATRMFLTHPLTGIGWGNFGSEYLLWRTVVTENSLYAHNVVLQVLAESGIVGFTGCLAFFIVRMKNIPLRSPHVLAVGGFLLYNLFDYSLYIPSHLFTVFVLLYSADITQDTEPQKATKPLSLFGKTAILTVVLLCAGFLTTNSITQGKQCATRAQSYYKTYTTNGDKYLLAQAIEQQELAVRASPGSAPLRSDLAWLYMVGGNKKTAKHEIMEAIQRDPLNSGYQSSLRQFMNQK
ncbi:MAG: O-antigen ligase family protein [Elusimicrobiota bacterium]